MGINRQHSAQHKSCFLFALIVVLYVLCTFYFVHSLFNIFKRVPPYVTYEKLCIECFLVILKYKIFTNPSFSYFELGSLI